MDSQESHSEQLIHLAEEYIERLRVGERPALSEYERRYPHLAEVIHELFPAMAMMEKVAPDEESLAKGSQAEFSPSEEPLTQLGDFRILRELGRGGMGVVYEAEQLSLGRPVALKVLLRHLTADANYEQRFEREARAAARLHHTHIVPVYGFGIHEGTYYYAMQYIPGVSLDGVVNQLRLASESTVTPPLEKQPSMPQADGSLPDTRLWPISNGLDLPNPAHSPEDTLDGPIGGPTPPSASNSSVPLAGVDEQSGMLTDKHQYRQGVARIAKQVARALEHAHKEGVLHRDVKPANLLLDTRGHVWITDFGLAKSSEGEDLTQTGAVVGTVRYLAPKSSRPNPTCGPMSTH